MVLRDDAPVPAPVLAVLRHCYEFVNKEWQHVPRDESADQGFETRLRESCVTRLSGWVVSQHREMNLGAGHGTASGVLHEVDIVIQNDPAVGIMELKNRSGWAPDKNDVIVFFAKILDYLCLTPALLRSYLTPIFVSTYAFEQSGLAACLGLGIHPIAPHLRPLPILVDNAKRMLGEPRAGMRLSMQDEHDFDDFCSRLNRMSSVLRSAETNCRFTYLNDSTIAAHALGEVPVYDLADELLALNGECERLLGLFRAAKGGTR